jgi:starch synthase
MAPKEAYYENFPNSYEQTREKNPADFLLSGVLAADYVNSFPHGHLEDIVENQKESYEVALNAILTKKRKARFAFTFKLKKCCPILY